MWDRATDIQRLQMISGMNLMPFLRINSCIEAINYFRDNIDIFAGYYNYTII